MTSQSWALKQSAQFLSFGPGHTESDLFLYLPEKKILFLGDLLFIENQPWLSDGDMNGWISTLDSIKMFDSNRIVPGHGPVGTKADIDTMVKYIQHIQGIALACKQKGTPPDKESSLTPPSPYHRGICLCFTSLM
jgi:flavorubredoxin